MFTAITNVLFLEGLGTLSPSSFEIFLILANFLRSQALRRSAIREETSIQCFVLDIKHRFNSLSANFTKWSNKLKQFVGNLPTNRLSVFDHFVGLALKGIIMANRTYTNMLLLFQQCWKVISVKSHKFWSKHSTIYTVRTLFTFPCRTITMNRSSY